MGISTSIKDSKNGKEALVTEARELLVTTSQYYAPLELGKRPPIRFLSGYLGSTGLDSGTTNANVNGSVTTQKFYLTSKNKEDIVINKLLIYIQDGAVKHNGMGDLGVLAKGVDLVVIENDIETYLVKNAKTFANLIEQTFGSLAFGDASTSFELVDVLGGEDAQILVMNLYELMPGGLRIVSGTLDRMELRVKDNLTGLSQLTVRVAGYYQNDRITK